MSSALIRPLALCLLRRSGSVLVNEAHDHVKNERFCRPIGGGIEFGESEEKIEVMVRDALAQAEGPYDIIILGCTHYPLVRRTIERITQEHWPQVIVIDPADAVADAAKSRFANDGDGKLTFRLSKDSERFRARVSELFPDSGATIEIT